MTKKKQWRSSLEQFKTGFCKNTCPYAALISVRSNKVEVTKDLIQLRKA